MTAAGLPPAVADWIAALWLLALGGAVGSFLNVVIYRLPAGLSLITPGSHCPACKHPIRWYDNIPVLSWILLRARCRDCGAVISSRYPAIEAVTAALFVGLGAADGVICRWFPDEALLGVCAYHLLLLCTLLAAAAIQYDGQGVPARLFGPALVVGLGAPLVWPHLHPVAASAGLEGWWAGLVGLTVGAMLGLVWSAGIHRQKCTVEILAPACVGLFLGYQGVLVVAVLSFMLWTAAAAASRACSGLRGIPPSVWIALATLAWIVAWPHVEALRLAAGAGCR